MTQEEKIILLQDLCMRLSHKVHCCVFKLNGDIKENDDVLYGVVGDNVVTLKSNKDECLMYYQIKPYLRPMSSMTDEEKCQFRQFIDWTYDCNWKDNTIIGLLNGNGIISRYAIELFDWLNKKMFDYRGLIPMGLALEAPKNMYKI